jgi:integrase/recombinase XerD
MICPATSESIEASMFTVRRASGGRTVVTSVKDSLSAEPVCKFLAYLEAKGYSPNTVLAYAHDVIHLWTFFSSQGIDWTEFSTEHSIDFLLYLRSAPSKRKHRDWTIRLATQDGVAVPAGRSAATINRALVAVSAFYDWAIFIGAFPGANPIAKIEDRTSWRTTDRHRPFLTGISPQKPEVRELRLKTVRRLPRPMNDLQIAKLSSALRNLRDQSLIMLMLNAGLRPGEALGLHLADINYGRRRVFVRCRDDHPKGARSKSRTERAVDLHDGGTLETLNAYVMGERPAEATSPFVFLLGGVGKHREEPLSYAGLARMFARACERADIREPWMTPHALRHTHATRMWEAGMRELTLQRRLGHASPESTRIYTRVSDAVVVAEYRRALGLGRGPAQIDGEPS